jgi:GNAT superfamily N-acetyltransferase
MQYQIHLARRADIFKLPAIEKAAATRFAHYLSILELKPEMLEDIVSLQFLLQAQTDRRLWVAQSDGEPVGFIVGRSLGEHFFIVELDVLPDYCRQGIGSALVNTLCQTVHNRGVHQVMLTTFRYIPWNIPFYGQLGFEILAENHWSAELAAIVQHEENYGFKRAHRVVMQKTLMG